MAIKIREGDDRDFVLLINGGNRQDVMQAHFHLFTDNLVHGKICLKKRANRFLNQINYFGNKLLLTYMSY